MGAAIVPLATSRVKCVYPCPVCQPAEPRVTVLHPYAGFRCRHSGVCCTSGWDIPLDAGQHAWVANAITDEGLSVPGTVGHAPMFWAHEASLPDGHVAVLARAADGACVFFDRDGGRLCAIHRAGGSERLPAACRHFPRVVLLEADRATVTFSHVCPTVADHLLRHAAEPLRLVDDPDATDGVGPLQGFDARTTVPPFVKPGVVFDMLSWRLWEQFVVESCSRSEEPPEQVLARLADGAERLRAWSPARGDMSEFASEVLDGTRARQTARVSIDSRVAHEWFLTAVGAVPAGLVRPDVPPGSARVVSLWRDQLPAYRKVALRYLAARAFGAWSAYLGDGLRTQLAVLAVSLAVFSFEVLRRLEPVPADVPDTIVREALRASDLLLVHLADDRTLCGLCGHIESVAPDAVYATLGLTTA
jgi:Fe-S-cluster containining protein